MAGSAESRRDHFFEKGWVSFPPDPAVAAWAQAAAPLADEALENRDLRDRWMRSGGTWFVGVNTLDNDRSGAIAERGLPPLGGAPVMFATDVLGFANIAWDRAQLSICLPGYPQPDPEETESAFRYRSKRDAAHVDGLLKDGEGRRRLAERHAFILGIPLVAAKPHQAPFVVYEGSHEIMREAFRARFDGVPPELWEDEDVTEAYVSARRTAFETCERREINVRPGESYMTHRMTLHGVAPWAEGPEEEGARRAIAYFRPEPRPADPSWWVERD